MSDQKLPALSLASELKVGDHVFAPSLDPHLDGVAELLFVQPYAEYGTDGVTVLLGFGGTTQPQQVNVGLDRTVRIPSAEEIAEAKAAAERHLLADNLQTFAGLIRSGGLPMERGQLYICESVRNVADLAAIGAALGIQVREGHDRYRSVNWPKGHEVSEPGLHVTWYAHAEKDPEPGDGLVDDTAAS